MIGPKKHSVDPTVKAGQKKLSDPGRHSITIATTKTDSVSSTSSNRSTKSVRIDEGYGAARGSLDEPPKRLAKRLSLLPMTNKLSLSQPLSPSESISNSPLYARDELPPIDKFQDAGRPYQCMERSYSCQTIGYHPRPDCSEFHIKRKDPLTKQVKMVPKMIHNLEANRSKVPEHQLIEDDWRAYRSVLHNRTKAKIATLSADEQREKFLRDSILARHCLGIKVDAPTMFKESEDFIKNKNAKLELASHKSAVVSPMGYTYRRYTDEKAQKQQQRTTPAAPRTPCPEAERLPLVVASSPFGLYHVSEEQRGDISKTNLECRSHDVDSILVNGMPEHITVYNEADSIPGSVLLDDFTQSLAERTQIAIDLPKASTQGTLDSKVLGRNSSSFFLPFPPRNSRTDDSSQTHCDKARSRSRQSMVMPTVGHLPNIDELLMQTSDILERRHKSVGRL